MLISNIMDQLIFYIHIISTMHNENGFSDITQIVHRNITLSKGSQMQRIKAFRTSVQPTEQQ